MPDSPRKNKNIAEKKGIREEIVNLNLASDVNHFASSPPYVSKILTPFPRSVFHTNYYDLDRVMSLGARAVSGKNNSELPRKVLRIFTQQNIKQMRNFLKIYSI